MAAVYPRRVYVTWKMTVEIAQMRKTAMSMNVWTVVSADVRRIAKTYQWDTRLVNNIYIYIVLKAVILTDYFSWVNFKDNNYMKLK